MGKLNIHAPVSGLQAQGGEVTAKGAFNAPGLVCSHRDFIRASADPVSPAHKYRTTQ